MGKFKRIKTKLLSVVTALVIMLTPLTLTANATVVTNNTATDETAQIDLNKTSPNLKAGTATPIIHVLTHAYDGLSVLVEYNGHFGMIDSGEDKDAPDGNSFYWTNAANRGQITGTKTRASEDDNIPYMKKLGVTKENFDFFIGTHPHSDHIGAADEFIREFCPKKVYLQKYSDTYITNKKRLWDNRYVYENTIAAAYAVGAELIQDLTQSENNTFYFGPEGDTTVQIKIKNYTDPNYEHIIGDANDLSLGVLIIANGKKAFISGDINNFSRNRDEDKLAEDSELANVDVMTLGHHGHSGSNSSNYMYHLKPKMIINPGYSNNFPSGHLDNDQSFYDTLWDMCVTQKKRFFATGWFVNDDNHLSIDVHLNTGEITTNLDDETTARTVTLSQTIRTKANGVVTDGVSFTHTINFKGGNYSSHSISCGAGSGGWQGGGTKWYYGKGETGQWYITGCLCFIEGKWYYFKDSQIDSGSSDNDGYIVTNSAHTINGQTYGFNSSGHMLKGYNPIGSDHYYFRKDGTAIAVGWVNADGKYRYFGNDGKEDTTKATDTLTVGWLYVDSGIYYFYNNNGQLQTGRQKSNTSDRYFFLATSNIPGTGIKKGQMLTGPQRVGNTLYYFKQGGEYCNNSDSQTNINNLPVGAQIMESHFVGANTRWINDTSNNRWYLFNNESSLKTGYVQDGSYHYYFNDTYGFMETNAVKYVYGSWKYFNADLVYGYETTAPSNFVTDDYGRTYYTDDNTYRASQWVNNISGSKYFYFNADGTVATGAQKIGDYWYYLGTGYKESIAIGECLQDGWLQTHTGDFYKADDDGYLCANCWHLPSVELEGATPRGDLNKQRYFYFGEQGIMATGLRKIDGKYYYFCTKNDITGGSTDDYCYGLMYGFGWKKDIDGYRGWKGYQTNPYYQYYFGTNGSALTGLQKLKDSSGKDNYYYFDNDGKLVTSTYGSLPSYLSGWDVGTDGKLNNNNGNLKRADDVTDNSVQNIDFKLFDYDESINFKSNSDLEKNNVEGTITSDDINTINKYFNYSTNRRPLAQYFAFEGLNQLYHSNATELDTFDGKEFAKNHATVERTLNNNYPVLDINRDANGNKKDENFVESTVPENDRNLGYLFGEATDSAVTSYNPTNTILKKNGYHYSYNSAENAVDYDVINNEFCVRKYTERTSHSAKNNKEAIEKANLITDPNTYNDFLPFNYTNGEQNHTLEGSEYKYSIHGYDVDYWFGMSINFEFYQSPDGKLYNTDGTQTDMKFNFSGDDDVWVFVDDVLVLDLGGNHGIVDGSIDFSSGDITQSTSWYRSIDTTTGNYPSYPTTLKSCFTAAGQEPTGGWSSKNSDIFADNTKHTLRFFYLERGAFAANCSIDFDLYIPSSNELTVEKNAYNYFNSSENLNGKDTSDYSFKIERENGDPVDNEFNYIDSDGKPKTVTTDGISAEFTLKPGEQVKFTNLIQNANYTVTETDTNSTIKKTDIAVNGAKTENIKSTTINAQKANSVVFNNYVGTQIVNLKYYERETVNGKPADINSTPTVFTKEYVGKEYSQYPNDEARIVKTGAILGATNTDNVLDGYSMFTSQTRAVTAMESIDNLHTENGKYTNCIHHTNNYGFRQDGTKWLDAKGNPTEANSDGEKWVTYYKTVNGTKEETGETDKDNISEVTVWLFNQPKEYKVEGYSANNFSQLADKGDKYVANNSKIWDKVYYNQRLGGVISEEADYSQGTDHLKAYGLKGYVDGSLDTAGSINKADGTTLKFAYWSYDENGNTVASTDKQYNYRITGNAKLYAVYTNDGKVNGGAPGLTATMNTPDVFFNTSGISVTRLNTMLNPYNCPNRDTNIKNVSLVYVIDKDGNLATADKETLRSEVETGLNKISKDDNGIPLDNQKGSFTISSGGNRSNYYAYVVDGYGTTTAGQINLTNKNRVEFSTNFKTSSLANRKMYAFVAMYYKGTSNEADYNEWIVSDNYIDYSFDANGKIK